MPICVSLRGLDREALIRILQEPKNALVKQYQKLFQMDNVELSFEQDAIEAIADKHWNARPEPEAYAPLWNP